MLYPQNGDRIVAIDSVTSLHPMCYPKDGESRRKTTKDADFFCCVSFNFRSFFVVFTRFD